MSMISRIRKIPFLIRTRGLMGTVGVIFFWLAIRMGGVGTPEAQSEPELEPQPEPQPPAEPQTPVEPPKTDIFELFGFLRPPQDIQPHAFSVEAGTINWVIPSFEIGSGGHLNIFRMIFGLEKLGYRSRIHIVGQCHYADGDAARQVIIDNFVPLQAAVEIGEDTLEPAEFTMATSWVTAYAVRRFALTRHKLYFIQDMESWFTPHGSEYVFAEETYRFGFTAVTAGSWLSAFMKENYGMLAYPFGFSCDHELYRPLPRKPGPRKVFFYARHVTPRRGFELGMLALKEVSEKLPDVEFILAGWDMSTYVVPFPHVNAGVVAIDALPEIYSQCDAALVISLTNLSLLPLELMACGCPVVSNRGPNVEWLLRDRETAMIAEPTAEGLAAALVELLDNKELHQTIRKNGLEFVSRTNWAHEAKKVDEYLTAIRANG